VGDAKSLPVGACWAGKAYCVAGMLAVLTGALRGARRRGACSGPGALQSSIPSSRIATWPWAGEVVAEPAPRSSAAAPAFNDPRSSLLIAHALSSDWFAESIKTTPSSVRPRR